MKVLIDSHGEDSLHFSLKTITKFDLSNNLKYSKEKLEYEIHLNTLEELLDFVYSIQSDNDCTILIEAMYDYLLLTYTVDT